MDASPEERGRDHAGRRSDDCGPLVGTDSGEKGVNGMIDDGRAGHDDDVSSLKGRGHLRFGFKVLPLVGPQSLRVFLNDEKGISRFLEAADIGTESADHGDALSGLDV